MTDWASERTAHHNGKKVQVDRKRRLAVSPPQPHATGARGKDAPRMGTRHNYRKWCLGS